MTFLLVQPKQYDFVPQDDLPFHWARMNSKPYEKMQTGNTDTHESRRVIFYALPWGWIPPTNTKAPHQLCRAMAI